jgi:hypothetical protein
MLVMNMGKIQCFGKISEGTLIRQDNGRTRRKCQRDLLVLELQNWMNSSGILRHKEHRSSEEKEHDFGFRYIKSELSLRCAK